MSGSGTGRVAQTALPLDFTAPTPGAPAHCGKDMMSVHNRRIDPAFRWGAPIYWCDQCGAKIPREEP